MVAGGTGSLQARCEVYAIVDAFMDTDPGAFDEEEKGGCDIDDVFRRITGTHSQPQRMAHGEGAAQFPLPLEHNAAEGRTNLLNLMTIYEDS